MLRLPYGISDFKLLVSEKYHFIDRTPFIERLEAEVDRYIFFLRPRRFGKSLWVSLLSYYYGIEHKDRFDQLFGNYHIGKNPTPKANSYHVLEFQFSGINTTSAENTFNGFLHNVRIGLQNFMKRYPHATKTQQKQILSAAHPNEALSQFLEVYSEHKIYLLIDEYDHFANEVLAFDFENFSTFVSRNGFVRKFYEIIKEGTKQGTIDRLFVTGVTPITLDSLTSGFNIATDFSRSERFHHLLGFSEEEVLDLIQKIAQSSTKIDAKTVLDHLRRWYNGYLFNEEVEQRLYNPDMVLYFLKEFAQNNRYPKQLIDNNIASDYGKLEKLFALKNRDQNTEVLHQLLEERTLQAQLTTQFSFERDFTRDDFISLLYYMGLVSIEGQRGARVSLRIPNHAIRGLYLKFFIRSTQRQARLSPDAIDAAAALEELAYENDPKPFLKLIEATLQALSNRDYQQLNEKHVQTLFVGFASLANLYFIKSEFEVERQYPDICLLYRPPFKPNFQFVIELKYLKKKEASKLKSKHKEAVSQLKEYLALEEIRALENLKAYAIVFVGAELKVLEEQ